MPSIPTLWHQIDRWFTRHAPSVWDPSASPGASEEELAQAEVALGVTLTEEFKASYRLHNGGCPFSRWQEPMMSLADIVGTWQMLKEIWEQGYSNSFPDEPPGPVQPLHWQPKWIPFLWGGYGGDYICLDLDPTQAGQVGQIILRTHESDPAQFIAPSFEASLAAFAKELKARKYVVEHGRLARKVPLQHRLQEALRQTKQRLLGYKRHFDFARQQPALVRGVVVARLKASASDSWIRLRSSPRTRWSRVIRTPLRDTVGHVAWSPDGSQIIATVGSQIQLWKARGGKLLRSFATAQAAVPAAWSPDGNQLALLSEQGVLQVIQAQGGAVLCACALPPLSSGPAPKPPETLCWMTWSADGTLLHAIGRHMGPVESWTVHSWEAREGVLLASWVLSWEAAAGNVLLPTDWQSRRVTTLAWSPDSTRLATASLDGTIRIWSTENQAPLLAIPSAAASTAQAQYLAWSPEGQRLAVGDDTRLIILDTSTGEPLATYDYVVSALAWSPDGSSIAISEGSEGQVRVLRVADGHSLVIYRRHMLSRSWLFPNKDTQTIRAIAWSPNGKYLVSSGDGRTFCLCRARLLPSFLSSGLWHVGRSRRHARPFSI